MSAPASDHRYDLAQGEEGGEETVGEDHLRSRATPSHASSKNKIWWRLMVALQTAEQCCGSGSVLDPYSGACWIRIRIRNTDPDPHMQI